MKQDASSPHKNHGPSLKASPMCPMYGEGASKIPSVPGADAPVLANLFITLHADPGSAAREAEVQHRISYYRSSQKRGPPALS